MGGSYSGKVKRVLGATIILVLILGLLSGCSRKESFEPDYDSYDTYVFFGTDSRADSDVWKTDQDTTGTEGAPSSDVIMLMKIDEDGHPDVLSVYRDTMLDVSGNGDLDKCNAAFRNDGPYGAINMLEDNLDIRISGYVTANFLAVADAIDALGGVEIDVPREDLLDAYKDRGKDSIDVINKLIDELNNVYGRDTPHIDEGQQVLRGIQAVAYSRLRYTKGSDMRRSERQREVLYLMLDKLRDADSVTQKKVLKEMYPEIDTDLAESELMDLFDSLTGVDMSEMQGFPYYKTPALIDEEWYDIPCDLEKNVTELHHRLYGEDEYSANETVRTVSKQIEERSGLTVDDAREDLTDAY